jgi:microcystin-dependent protein
MPQIQQIKSTDSDDAKRSKQNAAIDRVNELDNTAADISAFSASANAAARRASEARDEARDLAEGVDVATTDLFEAADTAVAARVAAEEARNSAQTAASQAQASQAATADHAATVAASVDTAVDAATSTAGSVAAAEASAAAALASQDAALNSRNEAAVFAATLGTAVQSSRKVDSGTGLTGGGDLSADRQIALTGQALAIHNLSTVGIVVRTGPGAFATRTLAGTTSQIAITSPTGASGNPTLSLAAEVMASLARADSAIQAEDLGSAAALDAEDLSPISHIVPTGAVMSFAMSSAPPHWLICDGSAVSRSTYSDLFEAIGATFGSGDGTTTFNLPDMRGEFIRGLDVGRGVDAARALGSAQGEALKSHTHTGSTSSDGAHTHNVAVNGTGTGGSNYNLGSNSNNAGNVATSSAGSHSHTFTTGSSGGTETRPRNIALLMCIKT